MFGTDGDKEIEKAVDLLTEEGEIWHGTHHILCVYHISQNLHKHLRKLFGSDQTGWHAVVHQFWQIVKATDVRRATLSSLFPGSWEKDSKDLIALVNSHLDKDSTVVQQEVEWLRKLLKRGHKFAARFTWSLSTHGVHSTQRIESTQAQVKRNLSPNSTAANLLDHIESVNQASNTKGELPDAIAALRQRKNIHKRSHFAVTEYLLPYLNPRGVEM